MGNPQFKKKLKISPPLVTKKITISARNKSDKKIAKISIDVAGTIRKSIDTKGFICSPPYETVIEICYDRADFEDQWTWGVVRDWRKDQKSHSQIKQFHNDYHNKKTWNEIVKEMCSKKGNYCKKHVYYKVNSIRQEAQKRLVRIDLDEWDEIFRFRLSNKFRFYGFPIGSVFLAIWHDPAHMIYKNKD